MDALISFWSHALAAVLFVSLMIWRLSEASRQPGQRLLVGALGMTACWAWLVALVPGEAIVSYAESARNLFWISLLYGLSRANDERERGLRLVYGAVAAVIGMQLVAITVSILSPSETVEATRTLLRITAVAGALVLVHNIYGQAAPESRSNIRMAMIGLALMWAYDLNYYTVKYLGATSAEQLKDWRGLAVAATAPFLALGARNDRGWRVRLSRAATFQSLSLLAICAYFALMAIVATALRGSGVDWSSSLLVGVLAVMTVGAMVVIPSRRARGWLKVKLAKHLFEHRYDYRSEWLRFTETLGRTGTEAPPLAERVVNGFADIVDSPGGLLLVNDGHSGLEVAAASNWPSSIPRAKQLSDVATFRAAIEASGRIVEFAAFREGWATAADHRLAVPDWMVAEPDFWAGIPLIHHDRLIGLVILAAPEFRRPLDWEDFDLLRTAGRQAASALAEARGQEALATAQRFDEFNRRFAFILHDIKNLVSQLSLVARNAERHADNPEFLADMIATLKNSVGKMNDLLTRLAPHSPARVQRLEPQSLRTILASAIAANRRDHDVQLLGDCTIRALVDGAALGQAIGHLVQNAVEASPASEPVIVRVTSADATAIISIIDNGPGMTSDFVRNQLFQPFASTKAAGFGIGAFEARSLILAMGGRMSVDSRTGKGTTFTIELPAAEPESEPARKRA